MEDNALPYHARYLDHGEDISPEDASFDPELQKTLAALYDRQRMESHRLYNDTSRPEAEIDIDMATLDIAHEQERTRYIEDYQRAKALGEALQRGPDPFSDEHKPPPPLTPDFRELWKTARAFCWHVPPTLRYCSLYVLMESPCPDCSPPRRRSRARGGSMSGYEGDETTGFQSPAQDYIEPVIDLAKILGLRKPGLYPVRVVGQELRARGIFHGDILIANAAAEPTAGNVCVAFLHGEVILATLTRDEDQWWLAPAASRNVVAVTEEVEIWAIIDTLVRTKV